MDPSASPPAPPGRAASPASHRAALFLWLLGGLDVALFGCCSIAMAQTASAPLEQFEEAMRPMGMSGDQIATTYQLLWPAAVLSFFLGFLPGIVYIIAGFGVRAGRRLPTNTSLLLAGTQAVVLGIVFAVDFVGGIVQGNLPLVTVTVLTLGTYLALLGYTIRCLLRAQRAGAAGGTGGTGDDADLDTDPWNQET